MKSGGPRSQSILAQMDSQTIYFCIKDKGDDLKNARKDSIVEFAQKRERAKSEAVDEISASGVSQYVQQLLDKEFMVFRHAS